MVRKMQPASPFRPSAVAATSRWQRGGFHHQEPACQRHPLSEQGGCDRGSEHCGGGRRKLTFTPNANWNGNTTFNYAAVDERRRRGCESRNRDHQGGCGQRSADADHLQWGCRLRRGLANGIADGRQPDTTNAIKGVGTLGGRHRQQHVSISPNGPAGLTSVGPRSGRTGMRQQDAGRLRGRLAAPIYKAVVVEVKLTAPKCQRQESGSYDDPQGPPSTTGDTTSEDKLSFQLDVEVSDGSGVTKGQVGCRRRGRLPIAGSSDAVDVVKKTDIPECADRALRPDQVQWQTEHPEHGGLFTISALGFVGNRLALVNGGCQRLQLGLGVPAVLPYHNSPTRLTSVTLRRIVRPEAADRQAGCGQGCLRRQHQVQQDVWRRAESGVVEFYRGGVLIQHSGIQLNASGGSSARTSRCNEGWLRYHG